MVGVCGCDSELWNKWHKKMSFVLETMMILSNSCHSFQRCLYAKGRLTFIFLWALGHFSLSRNSPTSERKTRVSRPLGIRLLLASLRSSEQLFQRLSPVTLETDKSARTLCHAGRFLTEASHPCRNPATSNFPAESQNLKFHIYLNYFRR